MTTSRKTTTASHPIHTVHRVGIGGLGLFLLTFGILGLIRRLPFTSSRGSVIMGLQSNGLLALLSVVAALILLAAAVHGARTASTVGIVFGVLFLLSGIVNLFLLGTDMNLFAFKLPNIVFSLAVGMGLLFTGAYGRLTGGLAPDSPYYHATGGDPTVDADERTPAERVTDRLLDTELAEAERAVAMHSATPEQAAGVRRASAHRTPNERRHAFRSI